MTNLQKHLSTIMHDYVSLNSLIDALIDTYTTYCDCASLEDGFAEMLQWYAKEAKEEKTQPKTYKVLLINPECNHHEGLELTYDQLQLLRYLFNQDYIDADQFSFSVVGDVKFGKIL